MTRAPHIIYIISDEHRGQAMSHTGDPNIQTPNMDRLAAEGISFSRAYCNCPVCTPSRGTIFSGRHAHAGPVSNFFDVYKPSAPSTATILAENGYHTAYFGKWHCGSIRDQYPPGVMKDRANFKGNPVRVPENFRAGFQDWCSFEVINNPFDTFLYRNSSIEPERVEGYQTDILTGEVITYLETYDKPNPLFLVLSVEPPHFICDSPKRFQRFKPEELQVRPNFNKLASCFQETETEIDDMTLRQILANYYACVENLDWNIGRLMDRLQSLPGFTDTITIYTSDHGDFVGSHGLRTTKIQEFEESVRIPAIFHGPARIKSRTDADGLFSLVDLMATTLDLAGIPIPVWNQGTNWAPYLRGESFEEPSDILLEMHGTPRWTPRFEDWRGLVTKQWKYAFHENRREALFDLARDPYEMNDLASENPEKCAELRTLLKQRLQETREPFFDVIIEHGVPEPPHTYLADKPAKLQDARRLGALSN